MRSAVGARDRDKLDEYFTSVRELEKRLAAAEEWSKKPKPKVDVPQPKDIPNPADLIGRTRMLFDLTHLALQTDSTRIVTILLGGASQNLPDFEAVNVEGTRHVLDAAEAVGMRRVVAVSTGTFFDTAGGLDREDAPVMKEPSSDPYTMTAMAVPMYLLYEAAIIIGRLAKRGQKAS